MELRISANFGLGLIPETAELLLRKAGIPTELRALAENQVLPHVSRLAALGGSGAQLDIFLLDLEAWLGIGAEGIHALADAIVVFVNTLEIALVGGAEVIVALAPCSRAAPEEASRAVDSAAMQLRKLADTHVRMQSIDLRDAVESYDVSGIRTEHTELAGTLPFTDEFQVSVGALIARQVFCRHGQIYKVVVVDCDNTLWTGECGSGEIVNLSEANLVLQQTLRSLVARGYLLCLASKNESADVLRCLRATPGMLISDADIAAFEVNWLPKSSAITSLASRLNLGADSFIFIDDDSFECADVSYHHPSVVVLPFTNDATAFRRHLKHLWAIDIRTHYDIVDDGNRAAWYRVDATRKAHPLSGDLDTFLQVIELSITMSPSTGEELPRLAQLTHRATQWNTTARGVSPNVLAEYRQALMLHTVRVKDRYGDYGIVGIVGCSKRGNILTVVTMALSCRALGKNVEFSIFRHLADMAEVKNCEAIEIPVHCTERNAMMRRVLSHCGFDEADAGPDDLIYRTTSAELGSHLEPRPYGMRPVDPLSSVAESPPSAPAAVTSRWHDLAEVAIYLSRADLLLRTLMARRSHEPNYARPIVLPRTPTEAEVLRIWQSVLPLREISVEDDFFDLQADSMRAVQILARVKRRLNVELPIDFLFEKTFSIATIAEAVDIAVLSSIDPTLVAEELARINAMSDVDVADQLRAAVNRPEH